MSDKIDVTDIKPLDDRMLLWNAVSKTNPDHTKPANKNFVNFTSIDPASQFQAATEQWGPFGKDWGLKNQDYSYMDFSNQTKLAKLSAIFYYPDGEFEININLNVCYMTKAKPQKPSYLKIDDEYCKKMETSAVSKSLAKLGFNADIFLGKFEDSQYLDFIQKEFTAKEKAENDKIEKEILFGDLYRLQKQLGYLEEKDTKESVYKEYEETALESLEQTRDYLTNEDLKHKAIKYAKEIVAKRTSVKSKIDGIMYKTSNKEGLRAILKSVHYEFGIHEEVNAIFLEKSNQIETKPQPKETK